MHTKKSPHHPYASPTDDLQPNAHVTEQYEAPAPYDVEDEESEEIHPRRRIRSLIFHVLYALDSFDYSVSATAVVDNLNRGFDQDIPLDDEVVTTADAVVQRRDELDEIIKPLLENWRFERLGTATRLILRFAIWELLYTKTPPTIVINEAIELAKCFSEKDAYKFINGILDEVQKSPLRKELNPDA